MGSGTIMLRVMKPDPMPVRTSGTLVPTQGQVIVPGNAGPGLNLCRRLNTRAETLDPNTCGMRCADHCKRRSASPRPEGHFPALKAITMTSSI